MRTTTFVRIPLDCGLCGVGSERRPSATDTQTMDCATTLLAGGGLASGCAGALLSKVLGYAVVAGSAALKLPQVRILSIAVDLSSVPVNLGPRWCPGRPSRLDDVEGALLTGMCLLVARLQTCLPARARMASVEPA